MKDFVKNQWLAVLVAGFLALSSLKGCGTDPTPPEPSSDISLPSEVFVGVGQMVKVPATTDGKLVRWAVPDGVQVEVKDEKTVIVAAQAKGRYKILAWTAVRTSSWYHPKTTWEPTEAAVCWLVVGDVPPVPPGPDPVPPGPTPDPSPIPSAGLRVLFLYESMDLGKLSKEQVAILTSTKVRDYLNSKCVKGEDGKTPEYRFFDKDTPLDNETKLWKDVFKRPYKELPWVCIGNGKTGYEGPLPKTVEETLKLLAMFELKGGK